MSWFKYYFFLLVNSQHPMELFSKNTIRLSGKKVLEVNINACLLLSNELSSTLGPCGFDKLIVDKQQNILITNDGITILKNINIEHPATLLLIEVAKTQDEVIGDGTTSVVLLCKFKHKTNMEACELLRNAKSLLLMNVHPSTISYVIPFHSHNFKGIQKMFGVFFEIDF
jgi:archaeal chaperonin